MAYSATFKPIVNLPSMSVRKVNWKYLLFKQFRHVPMTLERVKRIAGDKTLDFVHRYWFALWLAFAVPLLMTFIERLVEFVATPRIVT